MDQHSEEYVDYIQSNEWRQRCRNLIRKRGRRCEKCGGNGKVLEVHHLTYERLGHERDEDLEVVCRGRCHKFADQDRAEVTRDHQWQKRVNAWAAKVHGDTWFKQLNFDQVDEEFNSWLKSK